MTRARPFAARRFTLASLTAAAAILCGLWLRRLNLRLANDAYISGVILLSLVLFLAAYHLRKKLPFLPLGRSRTWLQAHIYAGLLSAALFIFHTHARLPRGVFERALFSVYTTTAASGIAGLLLTRVLPSRLTGSGEEVIFERIPRYRRELRLRAEEAILKSAAEGGSTTLSDLYARRLADFFARPRHFRQHLISSVRPRRQLLAQLSDLDRYLSPKEKEIASELADLIEAKFSLDHHQALQTTLKGWLFVHLPLTCSLLLLAGAHVVLIRAFIGGPG